VITGNHPPTPSLTKEGELLFREVGEDIVDLSTQGQDNQLFNNVPISNQLFNNVPISNVPISIECPHLCRSGFSRD
jgi:hypothetical protein